MTKITFEEIKQGILVTRDFGYKVETFIYPDKSKYRLLVLKYLNRKWFTAN